MSGEILATRKVLIADDNANIREVLTYLLEDEGFELLAATDGNDTLRKVREFRPDVLFLDEPTSGLDPMGIKTLRDLIVRLNREFGTTIFMNTHLISEISRTCTSIGVLNQGELVFRDTIEKVTERYGSESSLEELYLSVTPVQAKGAA